MWPLRAAILVLCCTGFWCHSCNLTVPYFKSRNFYNVLHWNEVNMPGQNVLYSVQYHIYGESYKPVTWCQNISAPLCDLTSVMTEVASRYIAKITANGQCLGEVFFTPFEQTILEAPKLLVSSNETSLNVTVIPPLGPGNHSFERISCWGICEDSGKSSMKYTVHLTKPKSAAGKVFQEVSSSVIVWLVETDTEYCGDVVYSFTHPFSPRQSETASFCVNVSARNSWFHIFIIPAVLAAILLFILPVMLCQQSVKGKSSLPQALIVSKNNPLPVCLNSREVISKVEVWTGFIGNSYMIDQQTSSAKQRSEVICKGSGYAAQDFQDHQWTCDSADSGQEMPADHSANSTESSVNYSTVVGVQVSDEPSTNGRTDKRSSALSGTVLFWATEPDSALTDPEPLLSDSDTDSKTLVVTVDANGALQIPGFFLQGDSLGSPETGPTDLILNEERTPLLTDLDIEGSRCNASYLPVHVSEISVDPSPKRSALPSSDVLSNYRQNWLPGMPLGEQQDQRTYIMRTDPPQGSSGPEEQEEDEDIRYGEEACVGGIFLEGLILQL